MEFCRKHWDMLHDAVKVRGMGPLVARNGSDAAERMVDEFKGTATDATYDPLMSSFWAIVTRVAEGLGPYIIGADLCPICEAMRVHPKPCPNGCTDEDVEKYFIDGPTDAALKYVQASPTLASMLEVLNGPTN